MNKGGFGEMLRREREMRGVALEEIAAATRISTRFLEALENERWDRLPGGVFNRGFIRAVARFLGLDEETLVAEYALVTNDPPEVAVWVDTPARAMAVGGPSRAYPWLVLLLFVVLAAGGWVAWQESAPLVAAWRNRLAQSRALGNARGPDSAPPAEVLPPSKPAAAGKLPAAAPDLLELTIEAGKATSVTVVADGKPLFEGKLSAGEKHRFTARLKFQVTAGDPSAVLLALNGQTLPPLGPPGETGSATLTRSDLKKPLGAQD